MNFLFYLLGSAGRTTFTRPGPRQLALTSAAAHLSRGNLAHALRTCRQLGRSASTHGTLARTTPLDLLIRGHLHLLDGQFPAAHHDFSRGIDRLLSRTSDNTHTSIEHLLSQADEALRRGRYVRAAGVLQQTRSLLDILLAAHAGLLLVEAERSPDTLNDLVLAWLVPLAKLSDITLRLLARAHLATHLSDSLRQRQLREDLAPWAVTAPCIDSLLDSEYLRLAASAREHPAHAEAHYRLALAARSANHLDAAVAAFTRTLQLHPYHVPSAARLVATCRQRGASLDLQPLQRAFHVPATTLATFAAFAQAASTPGTFDRAADRLCLLAADDLAAAATRANLAFALSELALLDPTRADWREPAPCTP